MLKSLNYLIVYVFSRKNATSTKSYMTITDSNVSNATFDFNSF